MGVCGAGCFLSTLLFLLRHRCMCPPVQTDMCQWYKLPLPEGRSRPSPRHERGEAVVQEAAQHGDLFKPQTLARTNKRYACVFMTYASLYSEWDKTQNLNRSMVEMRRFCRSPKPVALARDEWVADTLFDLIGIGLSS